MSRFGNINSRDLVALAREHGFWKIRQQGTSHAVYTNGLKIVVIPIHKGRTIGKGLAVKIINRIRHND
jgi:predicted RNA binding protein YcfA (HicA-like mRNA interferase family)